MAKETTRKRRFLAVPRVDSCIRCGGRDVGGQERGAPRPPACSAWQMAAPTDAHGYVLGESTPVSAENREADGDLLSRWMLEHPFGMHAVKAMTDSVP